MDSVASITLPDSKNAQGLMLDAFELMRSIDDDITISSEDNYIARLNAKQEPVELPDDIAALITAAYQLRTDTSGAFNPGMLAIKNAWKAAEIEQKRPSFDGFELPPAGKLTRDASGQYILEGSGLLDLGGIGKGYACGKAAELLRSRGVASALISAVSSTVAIGTKPDGKPWVAGIRDPQNPDGLIGYVSLTDETLSVSGGYERYFEIDGVKYSHILHSLTGYPPESGIICAVVLSGDAMLGDALSTALYVMGQTNAAEFYDKKLYDFEYLLVRNDGTLVMSQNMEAKFTKYTS